MTRLLALITGGGLLGLVVALALVYVFGPSGRPAKPEDALIGMVVGGVFTMVGITIGGMIGIRDEH